MESAIRKMPSALLRLGANPFRVDSGQTFISHYMMHNNMYYGIKLLKNLSKTLYRYQPDLNSLTSIIKSIFILSEDDEDNSPLSVYHENITSYIMTTDPSFKFHMKVQDIHVFDQLCSNKSDHLITYLNNGHYLIFNISSYSKYTSKYPCLLDYDDQLIKSNLI